MSVNTDMKIISSVMADHTIKLTTNGTTHTLECSCGDLNADYTDLETIILAVSMHNILATVAYKPKGPRITGENARRLREMMESTHQEAIRLRPRKIDNETEENK